MMSCGCTNSEETYFCSYSHNGAFETLELQCGGGGICEKKNGGEIACGAK